MSWVAVAIGGSALVGAGASYLGAREQADAAERASATQAGAADKASKVQWDMYTQNRADLAPWRDVGQQGLYSLADLMGVERATTKTRPIPADIQGQMDDLDRQIASWGSEVSLTQGDPRRGQWQPKQTIVDQLKARKAGLMGEYQYQEPVGRSDQFGYLTKPFDYQNWKDPGYDFRLGEGIKALDRSASARGDLFSGQQGKALTRFGQDYGTNEFMNAYGRWRDYGDTLYNRYAGLSGTGQTTATNIASMGQNTGQNVGNLYLNAGQAVGQGYQDAAAARASGYAGVANAANAGMGNYLTYNYLNKNPGYGTTGNDYIASRKLRTSNPY